MSQCNKDECDRDKDRDHESDDENRGRHSPKHNSSDSDNESCRKVTVVKNYYTTNNIQNGIIAYSDFFGLMPGDNSATVAPGTAVSFPQNGPTNGIILRQSASTFLLKNIGTYEILFQVSVTEAGQLDIALNSGTGFLEIPNSVVGRATGASQIVGISLIDVTFSNTVLAIWNPSGNSTALTITPLAGGAHPVSCHLVIKQIK